MGLRITTEIKHDISEANQSLVNVSNVIQGLTSDNPLITTEDLVVDNFDSKTWILDETQATSFTLDVMTLINTASISEVRFVHIQCHKYVTSNRERLTPIKFRISLDSNVVGNMSQFSAFNVSDWQHSTVSIDNITVASNEKAVLRVVIGLDK
jgi:hypothetical protein